MVTQDPIAVFNWSQIEREYGISVDTPEGAIETLDEYKDRAVQSLALLSDKELRKLHNRIVKGIVPEPSAPVVEEEAELQFA